MTIIKGETSMKSYNFKNIKAGILFILLLSFVLVPCAQPEPKPSKEVSIAWSEIHQGVGLEVGDVLEVVLPANPSTGYLWEVGFYNQSVFKPYGEPEFSSTSTNLGAEESQKLHFEAIGKGETELVLVYQRSFETEDVNQQTFQVYVIVK
jgi:inhibitor of cysteine peptidase